MLMKIVLLFAVMLLPFTKLSAQTPLPVDQDTLALWNFDQDHGATVIDAGPNQINGTAFSTDIFPINGLPSTFAQARYFSDQTSYIDFGLVSANSELDLSEKNEWTIEFMVNRFGGGEGIRNVFDNGNVVIEIKNRRVIASVNRNGFWSGLATTGELPGNAPQRVAVVFKNEELGIKVNGMTWATTVQKARSKKSNHASLQDRIRVGGTPRERTGAVKIGKQHACVTTDLGELYCWGVNNRGQLGNGTSGSFPAIRPTKVENLQNTSKISLGGQFSCALSNGKTLCWGDNNHNALGLPGVNFSMLPLEVLSLAGSIDIDSGENHSCAIASDKTLKCWGNNEFGQTGLGIVTPNNLPTQVPGLSGIRQISLGRNHSCAVTESNDVYCWGSNSKGQLGIDSSTPNSAIPQLVIGLGLVQEVEAGNQHSCACNV